VKHGTGRILHEAQERYLERLLPPRDPLLREMEELAAQDGVPISDPEVGRLLQILARTTGARRILEIGTAIGYGTLCLARGAAEATVTSIDVDASRLATARAFLDRAGVGERVELIQAPALEFLARPEKSGGPIDLTYLDGLKEEYRRTLDLLLPRLRVGGLVVIDNLLWKGWVADPPTEGEGADDTKADVLYSFNSYLMSHPQLEAIVLPLGDGVGLATKTRPLMSEMGGPF
jgi:predicted O-methyltransferase YrrM